MSQMSTIRKETSYLVFGSGLMPVSPSRMNQVRALKKEFHAAEVNWAMMAAGARKVA